MGFTKRTLNKKVEFAIVLNDKIRTFLYLNKIVEQDNNGKMMPVHRKLLLRLTDLEIISAHNAELRGICNYYLLASNFHKLNYFACLMEYSCLKILAGRHKCTTPKIRKMFKDGDRR